MNLTEAKQLLSTRNAELVELESLLDMVYNSYKSGCLMCFSQQKGNIYMRVTDLGEIVIDQLQPRRSTISFKFKSITMNHPDTSVVKTTTQNVEVELNLNELRQLSIVDEAEIKAKAKDAFNKLIDQI